MIHLALERPARSTLRASSRKAVLAGNQQAKRRIEEARARSLTCQGALCLGRMATRIPQWDELTAADFAPPLTLRLSDRVRQFLKIVGIRGWESGFKPLMRHRRFDPQLGKKRNLINGASRLLISGSKVRVLVRPPTKALKSKTKIGEASGPRKWPEARADLERTRRASARQRLVEVAQRGRTRFG